MNGLVLGAANCVVRQTARSREPRERPTTRGQGMRLQLNNAMLGKPEVAPRVMRTTAVSSRRPPLLILSLSMAATSSIAVGSHGINITGAHMLAHRVCWSL